MILLFDEKDIDKEMSLTSFVSPPEEPFDLIYRYGTYEIQATADTDNEFPAIAQGMPKSKTIKAKKHMQ